MVFPIVKRTIVPIVKRLWIKKINGLDNVPKGTGFIIAANHSSYLDHWILGSVITSHLDKKIHYLAKKEHFDSFHQRIIHTYFGAIPIDREKGGKRALRFAVSGLKKGKIIGIYPEGTRTLTGKIQHGKTGVARLALAAKVPVLPIGLIGTFKILPKGKLKPNLKKAKVNIGKPMYFDKYYGKEENRKTIRKVTDSIMREIAKLSNQKYKG
ncbi:lysophospholipid acyltransferase family protein [Nanoarchaeota archaeon]